MTTMQFALTISERLWQKILRKRTNVYRRLFYTRIRAYNQKLAHGRQAPTRRNSTPGSGQRALQKSGTSQSKNEIIICLVCSLCWKLGERV